MLPVALNLHKRRVLVIGGGVVAARKVAACLDAGALVTVISPALADDFPRAVEHIARKYESSDCQNFDLVFAATNDAQTNAQVGVDARSNKIWCNIADDPRASDFHTQSIVRREQIAIGVSTGRLSPVLARHLRERVEEVVGPEYEMLQTLAAQSEIPLEKRGEFWRAVLESDVLAHLRAGNLEAARAHFARLLECA